MTWHFLTKKLALIRKRTRQIQTNQAERTTQRKTSSKWAWTPRTSCRWRHRTSWRCFLNKQMFWTIVWNVRPKKLVKSQQCRIWRNKNKTKVGEQVFLIYAEEKKIIWLRPVVLRIFDKPFGQLTKIRRCVN